MRILLAEDELSLSRAVTALLERSNLSVDAVHDGEEALQYLEARNYDAMILDLMMPKVDGMTVLRRLREKGSTLPVLILSARSEIGDKVLGLDSGANDYLTKPFSTRELMARIRAITRTQAGQAVSRLSFGNITLDQTTFALSSPTGSYRLANKEYQMMELLLQNPHRLISTERFLERIWGYSPENTAVYLCLEKKGRTVQLTVENTTEIPLEKDQPERLFDRFYRADQSRNSRKGGHGLGLSIAKGIVHAHKGKIRAEAPDAARLVIRVALPD